MNQIECKHTGKYKSTALLGIFPLNLITALQEYQ